MFAYVVNGAVQQVDRRARETSAGEWLPLLEDPATYAPDADQLPAGYTIAGGQVTRHWRARPPDAQTAAVIAAARITVAAKVADGTLGADASRQVAAIFPPWAAGEPVEVGDIRCHGRDIFTCLQAHTTQADWPPDATPALWAPYRDAAVVAEWVQPTGSTDAYPKGAKVTHNGKTWTSDVAANVWEPGVSQWTQIEPAA